MTSFFPKSKSKPPVSKENSTESKSFNWTIFVYTSRLKGAGTDAAVYMQIFGTKGNTAQFFLDDNKNSKKLFEAGNCDRFDRNLADIGKPQKIKIGHDNKGMFAGWHLEKVVLHDNITDNKFVFHCNRWLAKDELDHQTEVELTTDTNRKSISISSWNSDDDDSLSANLKPSPLKQGILLKQIDEEKLNESLQQKQEIKKPPEISDFDSSDDEKFQPKQLNSTKKSDQISLNFTNVTPVQNADNNTSALSFLVKNNLPKQTSITSSGSQSETIGQLVASLTPKKQPNIEQDKNEDFNSSIKFLLDNNLVPEPIKKADSFDDLVEEFELGFKPKEQPKGLIDIIREEKNISKPMGIKELIQEEKNKNDFFDSDFSLSKSEAKSEKKETPGLKELIRAERKSLNSDVFDDFSSPRFKPEPKSETLDDLEKKFNNVMEEKTNSPIKALVEASIPPPGFRNQETSKLTESDQKRKNLKVSFNDSDEADEEIEQLASPRKPGVIDQGIGAFIESYRDSPSPRKPSFYDIIPEMLSDRDKEDTLERLRKKNDDLETAKAELEAQLNETEDQKKKFETGFNNLNRLLAEKEKLISQMNAEKFKNSLGNSLDLNAEIEKLKEEKQLLEKQLSEKRSLRNSQDFDIAGQNESLTIKVKALENQIEELNKDRKILADYKEDLCQKLDEQEDEIKNHQEALQLATLHFNVEKKNLNDEISKCKKELNDLNELKRNLELLVENLKKEIAEKNFSYEKILIEKSNFEEQAKKLGDEYAKVKNLYDTDLGKLKDEKYKLMEKLAIAEAKLINTEKDAQYTSTQIDERYKQVEDLREQLVKSKADFTIQLNLLQREKEEKDALVKKINEMESVIQRNLQEISDLKLRNLTQQQELNEKNENINIKIENENKKLQSDVKTLSEKLFKTETELEKLKITQRIEQSYDEFDFPDANEPANNKNSKKNNFNEKIHVRNFFFFNSKN